MSRPRALWQSVSELIVLASVTTKHHADNWGLVILLTPPWCLRAMPLQRAILIWIACAATRGMVKSRVQAVAKSHFWVHGNSSVGVFDVVHSRC